ncbi:MULTISPECIES: DUF3313 family protein [Colwellia]|uniref:Uncharacterized protein n=1 Tax=Colwellia marinimaniae TaxID=1513592 RepID=A0ABQ0MZW2_9GAMM|nr:MULTISPECIES: DUF3313 family protein [Colwellia]GAW97908.1 hypothetical protein MTCD1_03563 [Colwellia marinimaniae]
MSLELKDESVLILDVTAPDINLAINVKRYASDAGQTTLFLELYDGVSSEILARIVSTSVAGDESCYHWATRFSNRADAKYMIRKWAKALRTKYDEVDMLKTN